MTRDEMRAAVEGLLENAPVLFGVYNVEVDAIRSMLAREKSLTLALEELAAQVRGECPSLLNEDSGGDGELSVEIDDLLTDRFAMQKGGE